MPKSNVKLAFINDNKARKNSFMKRKECLKNKLKEVSILCSIEACVIKYSSYEPQLEMWPEDNTAFQNVLNAFLTKSPMERSKFLLKQDSYISEWISKIK
ncbi:putative transcription factor MADS-type1 family [Helianthus annuus]|uniref:Transcription factor MADS-type1 family n=1 Tax=Helianthus annuus TaxID=4232 RepID=A0A9K3NJN1_HELAN|nr:putative transcription factor MADS-type1 family [Helianthus annuus]KAJ0574113.1 putative transcription factor MADS-type1 family [Helianthus annuus]KAJ0738448.1 putative transcription factor MADS-type1 family [Helianthus annuus]KAJ0741334.1 putative transcription factor MADS-type1 family [Helianthus annuus]KAJ0912567.1 putative transcription factor MADS-type1 family [Helianthus annuus]